VSATDLLKISDVVADTGVSASTIRYYVREGLLGEAADGIVRTGRNMAYYPPEVVDRIMLVKRLQEERFMPLKVIKELLDRDPTQAQRMIEFEDRLLARVGEIRDVRFVSRDTVLSAYEVPATALDRLEELGVLTPTESGYDQDDVDIIESISHFRAGGYEQSIGFTVYDTLRYHEALMPLVVEEVNVLLERLADTVDVDRAVEIVESGVGPLRDLIGAMHSKLLAAELRRRREAASTDVRS
jgi:DNA-binding transcriptional MerR regulator